MPSRNRTVFLIFLTALLVGFCYMMRSFWVAAALALVTAMVLRPFHGRIEGWCRGRRNIAAMLSVVLTSCFIILPLGSIVATIIVELLRFSRDLTDILQEGHVAQSLDEMNAWAMGLIGPVRTWLGDDWNLRSALLSGANLLVATTYKYSPKFLVSTATFGFNVVLWVIFLFVLFADGPRLYHYFMETAPIDTRHERYISQEVRGMVTAVFLGMIATSAVNAMLMALAFAVCGIERPLIWALITFGFSFIPVVGAFSIWVGAAAYLFLTGAWPYALGLAIFGLVIISQVDNVVKPFVMRGRVNVHPILLLLSIVGGVQVLGPVGLIFGPVFLAIFLAGLHIYRQEFVSNA